MLNLEGLTHFSLKILLINNPNQQELDQSFPPINYFKKLLILKYLNLY